MIGRIHNAKACTFDGRDLFIASLLDERGRILQAGTPEVYDSVSEHDSVEEARNWIIRQARRRDLPLARITLRRDDGREELGREVVSARHLVTLQLGRLTDDGRLELGGRTDGEQWTFQLAPGVTLP